MLRYKALAVTVLGAVGAGAFNDDWRVIAGAAFGTFGAYLAGAIVTKESLRAIAAQLVSEHVATCPLRASGCALNTPTARTPGAAS
jgi:hypothetical protein